MTKPTTYHININNEIIVYDGIRLNFSEIEFPITNKGIIHFEKNNKDFSINVYENSIYITYLLIKIQLEHNYICSDLFLYKPYELFHSHLNS